MLRTGAQAMRKRHPGGVSTCTFYLLWLRSPPSGSSRHVRVHMLHEPVAGDCSHLL